jgi:L-iditol 2-dehydrogenase
VDLTESVMSETNGLGADIAIVAAPAAAPQEQAVHLVRKRGTVVLFASLPKGKSMLNIDSRAIHYNELRVVGTSDSAPWHVQRAVELLASGQVPADKLATHTLPLDQIQQAYQLMESGESLRVVLRPS